MCARDSLWVSLCISLPYMWEEEVLPSLSTFPWICVCPPLSLIPIAISLSLFYGYFCLSHPPLRPRIAGFPGASNDKESACNVGDPGSWFRKIPWRRARQPIPVFLLENSMDRGAWQATVHGVSRSRTEMK